MDLNAEYRTLVKHSIVPAREHVRPIDVVASIDATWMEDKMGRGLLLWLIGVPIPVIILLWLFFGR